MMMPNMMMPQMTQQQNMYMPPVPQQQMYMPQQQPILTGTQGYGCQIKPEHSGITATDK